jgi:hypothetical protein
MKLNNKHCGVMAAYVALVFASIFISNIAQAESFGIKFLGSATSDTVTGTAGVVPIPGWNNIANGTYTSGTILSSDGSLSVTLSLGGNSANTWHSGSAADGANSSLLDGYMDIGNSGPGTAAISGLTGAYYTVYVYTEPDTARPGNGGDWLPNYSANNLTNFAAERYGAFTGFIQSGTALANNNTYPPGLTYGNYNVFYNVVPVGGVITVSAGQDTRTWRSPLNGIELVEGITVSPIAITTQPFSQRILTNTTASFSVAASGTFISYQWFKVSGGITNLLSGETNLSYTTPPVLDSDAGTAYFAVLTNSISNVVSSNAVITPGHLIGPVPGFLESDQYNDNFSTPLTAFGDINPFSTWFTNNSPSKIEYLTSFNDNQDVPNNGGERIYGWFTPTVTANYTFYLASDDQALLWLSTDNTPANVYNIAQVQAWMYSEDWALTQSSSAEAGGYGTTGEWRSDQFELSGGGGAANVAVASGVYGSWSPWPGLNGDGSITLTAGTQYYIEVDHWQGNGGQCAGVTYKIAGQPDPAYQSPPLLAGGNISTAQALDGAVLVITNQPVNVAVPQNSPATFSVVAGTYVIGAPNGVPPALEYQWQSAPFGSSTFTNIPGASSKTYTTPLLGLGDNGNQYKVILTTLNAQTNSSVAAVTVNPDVIKPVISEIGATSQKISVTWNKLLDPASAINTANYAVSGGVTITSATLTNVVAGAYAAATVQLGVTGVVPGDTYVLTVNNVKDLSQVQTVAANTKVPFTAYNVFLDFNEGAGSLAPAVTNVNGLATLGLNSGVNGGGGVTLQIPSGGSGGFVINDPLSGAAVNNFIATFKLFMGPFPNNNNNNPGPGGYGNDVAFSFGPATSVYWGATTIGGSGINGAGVLAVTFPTSLGASGVSVYYGGVLVTNVSIADNTVLVNGQWVDVTVQLNSDGTVYVDHNGTPYISNLALPGYTPVSAGNFLFGADSGLNWEISSLDNIGILENASLPRAILGITQSGANATLAWTPAGGRLQTTGVLGGGWTDVHLSQPATLLIGGTNTFFRVVVP